VTEATFKTRPAKGECGICVGDPERRMAIDRGLAAGKYPSLISREMRGLDWNTKPDTITRHREHWIAKLPATERDLMARLSGDYRGSTDLAELVRDDVKRRVEDGDLAPTLQHGLIAQQMIDRREERAQDRELAIGLARMLSGGKHEPPARVIDGSATRGAGALLGEGRRPDRVPLPEPQNRYRTTDPAS
jgi:hypothetical protein